MSESFEQLMQKYAQVVVKLGLNIRPGQRLLIGAPILWLSGVPIQTAPFVSKLAEEAYKEGASLVDVIWNDDQLQLTRFNHAGPGTFSEYPTWQTDAANDYAKKGDALLFSFSETPDLLNGQDPKAVAAAQEASFKYTQPIWESYARRSIQGVVISIPTPSWAAKMFPDAPKEKQIQLLWNAIFDICRLKEDDMLNKWKAHVEKLEKRSKFLNDKQFSALKYTAPGTDLMIGLPKGHIWTSSKIVTSSGVPCVTGFPCEEIFTLAHKDIAEGVVSSTKPLCYGGSVIENFSLTFKKGEVVKIKAEKGEEHLRKLIDTDEGARSLGEVSLLPHSSPVSQSGLLYYNVLVDENAANHIALGRAYRFNLQGGEDMDDETFFAAGGNQSAIHVDFMIGSQKMDVDGVKSNGAVEPLMRDGEWANDV